METHANLTKTALGLTVIPPVKDQWPNAAQKTVQVASDQDLISSIHMYSRTTTFGIGPWPTWAGLSLQTLWSVCGEAMSVPQGPDLLGLGCQTRSPGWTESRGRNDESWRRECWPTPRSKTERIKQYLVSPVISIFEYAHIFLICTFLISYFMYYKILLL